MSGGVVDSGIFMRSSFVERHARSLASVVPTVAAVVAATVVLVIGRSDGHWQFQRFFEDLVRNVFLGGLVAVVLLWLGARERALDERSQEQVAIDRFQAEVEQRRRTGRIAVTRTQLLSDDRPEDASADLRTRSDRMRENAAQLSAIHERWLQPPLADCDRDWNVDAQKAGGIVWDYIEHGSRTRLRVYLEHIARELPTGASPRKDIYASADERFRDAVAKVISGRIATDAVATEELLVMPVVHAGAASHGVPRQLPELGAEDHIAVCAVEPLYLLYMHLACPPREDDSSADGHPNTLSSDVISCVAREMRYAADALHNLSRLVEASTEEELATMVPL
jgi:hypothetical protein